MNLIKLSNLTEDQARKYVESVRWPNGPVCPHCGSTVVIKLQGKTTRPGVYKCKAKECRKQFTVTVNTIMERSHIPMKYWVMAFHLMCSNKKGVSAHQIHRELGCTYKTAWFLCHRIRYAMSQQPLAGMLSGIIEADDAFVGGKPRYHGQSKRGRGTKKVPVRVLVQRDGKAVARPTETYGAAELRSMIHEVVDLKTSRLMSDEDNAFRVLGREFAGGHRFVNHRAKEYVRDEVHNNTAESFFALLKRGHYGIFHKLSKKHLHRYVDEFTFRWNHRKVTDGERTEAAIASSKEKRLTYKQPVGLA